jgi:hypothetical protein
MILNIYSEGNFMVYDRKIKYLDYIVDGEKVRGAGFVKAEVRDEICRMQIHIDGVANTASAPICIILCSKEKESTIAATKTEDGKGDLKVPELNTYRMGDKGVSYFEIDKIIIPLGGGRSLRCIWNQEKAVEIPQILTEAAQKTESERGTEIEEKETEEKETKELHAAHITSDEMCRSNTYKENKWNCLAEMYEHGNILGEMEDCIIINPGDFVIMPEKYYKLAGNSFLLHGYHSYGYVLLIKMKKKKEAQYYIGVPGSYYEKEKDAAILFGFAGFESGQDYVRPGDFGYYMVPVEL